MRTWAPRSVMAVGVAGCLLGQAGPAHAQTTRVSPSVVFGVGSDDNIFWAPTGDRDMVMRLTPGLTVTRESARTKLFGSYSFDAERYQRFPALTNPFARQSALATVRVLPSSATTLLFSGGFQSTLRPSELNAATGLGTGVLSGHRWQGSAEWRRTVSSSRTVDLAYEYVGDALSLGDRVFTHGIDLTTTRRTTTKKEWRLKLLARRILFNGPDAITSTAALAGWTNEITSLTSLSVNVGARISTTRSGPRLEVDTTLARQAGPSESSLSYQRTQATAVGLTQLIDVDRLLGVITYKLPARIETTLEGGVYRNVALGAKATVYRTMADVTKFFANGLGLSVSYSMDLQHGLLGTALLPGVSPSDAALISPATPGWVRRNLLLFRVLVVPGDRARRKATETPDGGAAASGGQS